MMYLVGSESEGSTLTQELYQPSVGYLTDWVF